MGFFAKLLLGNGTLKPKLREELESEGLVLIEEGLSGTVRYDHFKAPGKRFHGKVTGERIGLGISEHRLVVFCRSGRAKLINSPFSEPRFKSLDVSLEDGDTIAFHIDYSRIEAPGVEGEITIRAKTPSAANIVDQVRTRLAT